MAAKRVDPLKAKEAKQKKIAIGGAVLLVLLVAVQGPKTLKMLKGPQPVASAAPAPATPAPGAAPAAAAPPTGGTAAGSVPAAPAADLASVPNSDPAPQAEEGQLVALGRFASKDPFAQQAQPAPAPAAPAATKPDEPEAPQPDAAAAPATGGFTTGGTTTTEPEKPAASASPAPVAVASATSIAVNGVAEDVEVDVPFPVAEPTFVLVSVAADGKSVEIGIAGGAYANGGETLKLALGKKVTLQNTADGSRFELELRAVEGQPLRKSK